MTLWSKGSPLSYQQFSNINYKHNWVSCVKFQIDWSCKRANRIRSLGYNIIHPYFDGRRACTMMSIENLAEPHWMTISCTQRLFNHIVCTKQDLVGIITLSNNVTANVNCPLTNILLKQNCFKFQWKSKEEKSNKNIILNILSSKLLMKFEYFFDTLLFEKSNITILTKDDSNSLKSFIVQRYLNSLNYKFNNISFANAEGWLMFKMKELRIIPGINLYKCRGGSYIISDLVCNDFVDSPYDQSDEELCVCQEDIPVKFCKHTVTEQNKKTCNHLYYTTLLGNCQKYNNINLINQNFKTHIVKIQVKKSFELEVGHNFYNNLTQNHKVFTKEYFKCSSGKVISKVLLDDIVSDCGSNGEDEPMLKLILNKEMYHACEHNDEIPCMIGHKRCYKITDICIYKLNMYKNLSPCRNGAHLQSCSKFECNMMFKCMNAYCIPWSYVCNEKWDCPMGHDEAQNICKQNCKNMFKCKGKVNVCLHVGNVCDKNNDCPFEDDELFCHFEKVQCPSICSCLLYAITCQGRPDINIIIPYPETYVFIFFSNVKDIPELSAMFINVLFVVLPNNFIDNFCNIAHFPKSLYVNVKHNIIKRISKKCFNHQPVLRSLVLSDNKILVITTGAFYNLPNLIFVNLSNNPLMNVPILFSKSAPNVLHMIQTQLQVIDVKVFNNIYINVILTKNYHICCIAPRHAICLAKKPWYISCSDILPNQTINLFYGIISTLVIVLNITSIMVQILNFNENKCYSVTVISININDNFAGVYLMCIWIADLSLKGTFSIKEHIWRSVPVCITAFTILLWFTIFTQILLLFLSLSRLMIVIRPVNTKFKQLKFVVVTLGFLSMASFLFSVFISSTYINREKYIPTSLCLPFIDPTAHILMIKLLTWFVVITQTLTSLSILAMHILLIVKIRESEKKVTKLKSGQSNVALIVQLLTITTSNIFCWFPANAIYVAAMFLSRYPTDLIIWMTVISLPMNSLINPFIFIMVYLRKYI